MDNKKFLENNLIGNALKVMVCILKALNAFDSLPNWNVISWNDLIIGDAKHGYGKVVMLCLEEKQFNYIN